MRYRSGLLVQGTIHVASGVQMIIYCCTVVLGDETFPCVVCRSYWYRDMEARDNVVQSAV